MWYFKKLELKLETGKSCYVRKYVKKIVKTGNVEMSEKTFTHTPKRVVNFLGRFCNWHIVKKNSKSGIVRKSIVKNVM